MSQNDLSISNADGATVRADINSALQALGTLSSGTSAPSTTYAGQLWWDTTNNLIKIRNGANNAWVNFANWDGTTLTFDNLAADSVTNAELANSAVNGQTDTIILAGDEILFADVSDSNNLKKDTVQGILDLAGGGAGLVLLSTATASASATIDFTSNIDSTYEEYEIHIIDLIPATDEAKIWLRTSTDGGSTFDSGGGNYAYGFAEVSSGSGTVNGIVSTSAGQIVLTQEVGNAAGEAGNSIIRIFNPAGTNFTQISAHSSVRNGAGVSIDNLIGGGARLSAADVDAIRILMSTGNITSGEFKLYGIQKS